jgi:uncharacterized protein (DUF4213/DUF364 family)
MAAAERLLEALRGDARVRQLLVGAFWTAVVLDTDPPRCGLASTLRPLSHASSPAVPDAGELATRSAQELALLLRSPSALEASIGMAAYNALLDVDEDLYAELNAEELIVERGTNRHVVVVGHFPFVERVQRHAAQCEVLELNPRAGDLPADQASKVLPDADVVALTGTSLMNGTFDGLMRLCRPDAFVVLLGPSTPLASVVFDLGVDAVSGTLVIDAERVVRSVAQGATFRQIKRSGGLRLLTRVEADAVRR